MAVLAAEHCSELGENIQPSIVGSLILSIQCIVKMTAFSSAGINQILDFRTIVPAHQKNHGHSDSLSIHTADSILIRRKLIFHRKGISTVGIGDTGIQNQVQEHMANPEICRITVHRIICFLKPFLGIVPVNDSGIKGHHITAVPDGRISIFVLCHIGSSGIEMGVFRAVISHNCGSGNPDTQKKYRQKKPFLFQFAFPPRIVTVQMRLHSYGFSYIYYG